MYSLASVTVLLLTGDIRKATPHDFTIFSSCGICVPALPPSAGFSGPCGPPGG